MSAVVLQGDMAEKLAGLALASFDCVVTDPPYGETSLVWDRWPKGWPARVLPYLKPSGSMWVFGSLRMFVENWADFADWKMSHEIVWEKHNGTGLFNDRFRRVHELAIHFYPRAVKWRDVFKSPQFTMDATARTVRKKGRPAQWIGATGGTIYVSHDGGPRLMRSVLQVRSEHGRAEHPTQKPEGIIKPLLDYACPEGGRVLDPFGGSGTVGLVADKSGRHATLIEANAEYASAAGARIAREAAARQIATFESLL